MNHCNTVLSSSMKLLEVQNLLYDQVSIYIIHFILTLISSVNYAVQTCVKFENIVI